MRVSQLSGLFWCLLILVCLSGCKTKDIEPLLTIRLEGATANRMAENGGQARLVAELNGSIATDITVNLNYAGTATRDVDYSVLGTSITIPAGSTSGALSLASINDESTEGDETIIVTVLAPSGVTVSGPLTTTITISDDDADTDADGVSDARDGCPTVPGPASNFGCPLGAGLIFNEVLYDPSNVGLDGDANADGTYDQNQDEFIELVNTLSNPIDLSGFTVSDSVLASGVVTTRYTFGANTTLAAGKALVLFGGGTATGSFGGSTVLVCPAGTLLSLQNAGEAILIKDNTGRTVISFNSDALSDNPNEAYTRNPDITGSTFVQHTTVPPGRRFSPGTKADGSNF